MDYNKMYCGNTELDKLVREKTSQGWHMFAHEHPTEGATIDILMGYGETVKDVKFQQKYLYKNNSPLGTCAIARFWK